MLEDMASESGITDSVFFHGGLSRRELYGSLCTYDIMVHPARTEGFGLVIAEGLAAGLKMVVSDIAGPVEVVDGGRRGLVVEPRRLGESRAARDRRKSGQICFSPGDERFVFG